MTTELSTWTINADATLAAAFAAPPVAGRPTDGAVTGADGGQPVGPAGPAPSPFGGGLLFPLLFALMLFLIVSSVMGGRKEKKRRAAMLSSLKRHDRVQTVGGVIGTVAEVRDDEVVLKVDESTNTKIRFSRGSIQQILKSAAGAPDSASEPARPEKIGV